MPGMSKRDCEDREVSVDRIKSAEPVGRLVFDLAKTYPCQFVRLLKVKCGSPCRRQIARGQQLDAAIGARLPIPLSFANSSCVRFWPKADISYCTAHVCF